MGSRFFSLMIFRRFARFRAAFAHVTIDVGTGHSIAVCETANGVLRVGNRRATESVARQSFCTAAPPRVTPVGEEHPWNKRARLLVPVNDGRGIPRFANTQMNRDGICRGLTRTNTCFFWIRLRFRSYLAPGAGHGAARRTCDKRVAKPYICHEAEAFEASKRGGQEG